MLILVFKSSLSVRPDEPRQYRSVGLAFGWGQAGPSDCYVRADMRLIK